MNEYSSAEEYRIVRLLVMIALIVFGGSPAFAFQTVNPNPDLSLLWEQVQRQPDDFAIGCIPLSNPSRAVVYNIDRQFPLASVGKLLIFIEYANRLDDGSITIDEMVSVDDLNRYDLTGTDGGAHQRFMATYPEGTTRISLWDVARVGMMQYSSNAASDYVLQRIEPVDWERVYRSVNVFNTETPHPLTMIALMMSNHEIGRLTLPQAQSRAETLFADGEAYFQQFLNDPQWHAAELEFRDQRRRGFPDWNVQSYVLNEYTMTGTVRDFLNVQAAIYGPNGLLPENVKQLARSSMRWTENAAINNTYLEYGSKLGFYSGGVLTLVAYGQPRNNNPVISVTFLRNIPRETYFAMQDEDTIGNLAHWMNLHACEGLREMLPTS